MSTVAIEKPVKLLLGGRTTKIDGFLNVDLYEGAGVDVRTDASDLSTFQTDSVDEIYASHILEHFSHTKTVDVLREWRRVLKVGGKLYVSVPDFARAIELYLKRGMVPYIVNLLWGDQGYDLAYHYAPFTYPRLMNQLMAAGFRSANRLGTLPYGIKDCSKLIDTIEGKPISLNMEAVK